MDLSPSASLTEEDRDDSIEADALLEKGDIEEAESFYDKALTFYEQALSIYKRVPDYKGLLRFINDWKDLQPLGSTRSSASRIGIFIAVG